MNASQLEITTIEKIKLLIRSTSAGALEAMAQKPGVSLQEISADKKIFGHWMSLISISGDQLHITFKVQFSVAMARAYAGNGVQENSHEISNSHSKDFIREYCNLLAGIIKNKLAENDIIVGISLPLLSRGFDNLFFTTTDPSGSSVDRWKLAYKDLEIFCISDTDVVNQFTLDKNFNDNMSISGNVEFF